MMRLLPSFLALHTRPIDGPKPTKDATADLRSLTYDEQTVEVMRRVMQSDSIGVDVGAHSGDILRHMVALAPRGKHYAFEPIPRLASLLRVGYPDVTVHECALSDSEGETGFELVTNDPGYSGLRRRLAIPGEPIFEQITVKTARLDSIIPTVEPVAFIKIDVEGAEYLVLRGAIETIRRCRPLIVFEAGRCAAGVYDVTPEALFRLVTGGLELKLGLMARWLEGRVDEKFSEAMFVYNWMHGPDYYFIAYP